ncbi:hypothetical protein MIR68_001807 [Amoeboaphelidium protococcarum]|nr:hypothetical protein MIR68_001807 [Amoeboaphelidium protococcarum]
MKFSQSDPKNNNNNGTGLQEARQMNILPKTMEEKENNLLTMGQQNIMPQLQLQSMIQSPLMLGNNIGSQQQSNNVNSSILPDFGQGHNLLNGFNSQMPIPGVSNPQPPLLLSHMQKSKRNSVTRSEDAQQRKRRLSHREVEKRRREHINEAISKICALIKLTDDGETKNKGEVLDGAVIFIEKMLKQDKDQKERICSLEAELQKLKKRDKDSS